MSQRDVSNKMTELAGRLIEAEARIEALEAALRACEAQLEYFAEPDQPAILSALRKARVALEPQEI